MNPAAIRRRPQGRAASSTASPNRTSRSGLSELARRSRAEQGNGAPARRELVEPKASSTRRATGTNSAPSSSSSATRCAVTAFLRDAALPYLADLFVLGGETVHLAVRDGDEVMYVERLVGHRSTATPSRVGGRFPLHCTATGKVLLTYAPDDVVERVLVERPRARHAVHDRRAPPARASRWPACASAASRSNRRRPGSVTRASPRRCSRGPRSASARSR